MFTEEELLPLSGIQHVTFCERRWALVQIEQVWADNRFTAEGTVIHERAHSGEVESRPGVLVRRTLPVRSFRLGLSGQADIVEFYPVPNDGAGVRVDGKNGWWRPYPVEYKRKRDLTGRSAYAMQLCAQALCLEEMLGTRVEEGAIYDGTARRRQLVCFTPGLRQDVELAAARMHELFRDGVTPAPVFKKACRNCSLIELCQPQAISKTPRVAGYLASALSWGSEGSMG